MALDGIIKLIKEGIVVADNSVVNRFAYWDYIYIQISQLVISGNSVIK